jgi:phosphoribosylformimino-5-aminoimidazole carboxamide ribotide isomerase
MDIFPAIDLRRGQVVRLRQGDPTAQITFSSDPAATAQRWLSAGARWLHVVNLDGAFSGKTASENASALKRIMQIPSVRVQFGGGLRDLKGVADALALGVARVVLGTVAIHSPEMVREAVIRYGAERIVVGLDAKDGIVATHGWQVASGRKLVDAARQMGELGVRHIVFTDIGRDGMLEGVNIEATRSLARESGLQVIASGGVASLDDIRRVAEAGPDGVEGVIIGQALYTGAVDLKFALSLSASRSQAKTQGKR